MVQTGNADKAASRAVFFVSGIFLAGVERSVRVRAMHPFLLLKCYIVRDSRGESKK
jgi:hypothetical protein